VGGALSRHTSTWQVQAAGGTQARQAEWCPEASSRGDAKKPRNAWAAGRARLAGGVFLTPEGECASRFEFEGFAFAVSIYFLLWPKPDLDLRSAWIPLVP
jgi:hypothetical protein